jgi:hypothetical protein
VLNRRSTSPYSLIKPLMTVIPVTVICAAAFFIAAPTFSPPPGWLDAHSRPGTIAVWGVSPSPARSQALGEIVSGNNNLSAVYFTRKPDSRGFNQVETRVTRSADGTVFKDGRPLTARYVLTQAEAPIVGTLVAKRHGFAIYEVRSHVRFVG